MLAQEVLNTVWYRFTLYTAKKAGRWPNYTTGKLYDLPELRYNVRRGRVEAVQVYQFDHVGQELYETTVQGWTMIVPHQCLSLIILIVIILIGLWVYCLCYLCTHCCKCRYTIQTQRPIYLQNHSDSGIFEI